MSQQKLCEKKMYSKDSLTVSYTKYIAFLFAFFCACSQPALVTEDQGERYLSLYPAITETIFFLQGQEKLVGRSDYCTSPQEANEIPSFGTSLTPNYEAIARSRPSHILTDRSVGTQVESLEQLAPLIQLPWLSLEDVYQSTIRLGVLLQKENEGQKLAEQIQKTFQSKVNETSPSLLILMQGSDIRKGQLWFMKAGSLHGSAIEAAGFRNAAPNTPKGPPSMSLEQLLKQNPDIVLFVTTKTISPEEVQKLIKSLDMMSSLDAVQNKRVGVINGENLMGVGPGIVHLVDKIHQKGNELLGTK